MIETQHQNRLAWPAVLGFVAAVFGVLGGLGCSSRGSKAVSAARPPVPPPLPEQFAAERSERAQAAAAMIAPQPPKTVTWRWTFPPGHKLAWWETSEDLQAWRWGGWTTNNYASFQPTNRAQFFVFYSCPWSNSLRAPLGQPQPPDFSGP